MIKENKILLLGATGYVGKALIEYLLTKGFKISVVGRSKEKINNIFDQKVESISWEQLSDGELNSQKFGFVINLAGASIADKRWTKERKEEIFDSRIKATQIATQYCLKTKTPLLNASAVGIYGQQVILKNGLGPALDENSSTVVDNTEDFLSFVCRGWEKETEILKSSGVRVVNLRTGVVLGKAGGALSKMAIPFYLFAGGPIGSGYQAVPWISLCDLCRAVEYLMKNEDIDGPVNLVAPGCVTQKELGHALGKVLKRPSFIPTPGFILKIILGQMAEELLLNGQNVYPKKLIEHGFEFENKTIIKALGDIYETK
jgi:uncharacterized protein (TIGR01777 family)